MKYENILIQVPNYATFDLRKTLMEYGGWGFKLVNVTMAKNKHNVDVMYLFFTRELKN